MVTLSRGTVRCTRCRATGLFDGRAVCPLCEGSGEYQRLIVPLKVVSAADLFPSLDVSFRRMAVMLSEHTGDGRVVLRGVTDAGMGLVALMTADRFAEIAHSEFAERDTWWTP
jgi:hypothetical protein